MPDKKLTWIHGNKARLSCPSCQLVRINGIVCHETGCPSSHLFVTRDCKECGSTFNPTERVQSFCSPCCAAAYGGGFCDCDACAAISAEVAP